MLRKWVLASVFALSGAAFAGSEGKWQSEEVGQQGSTEDSARDDDGRRAEEIGRERSIDSAKDNDEGIQATDMERRLENSPLASAEIGRLEVGLTGGVSNYTGQLGASSVAGPVIGVQVGSTWRGLVGYELGYEASRNPIDDSRVGDNEAIQRHNLSAFAKVGPTLGVAHPFVGAGLGASYVNVTDGADDSGLYRNDFLQEVPLGVGVEANVGALQAGVRGTYRVLFNDEFQEPTPASDNPSGGLLSAQLTLGGTF